MMATPGMAQMYQELRISCRPSPTSRPQLATLGSPNPRNDTADSNRMAPATTSEESTITGGSALGSISPAMILKSPMPMARQACTNSRSRKARNSARVMRAIGVQLTMPMAITMLVKVEPRMTTMVSTKIRLGMVWNSSAARMAISSIQPPK